ncbi:alpha/beta fold hydrolase [Streptomyces hoynatensis]|nr:alpha/beta fold hydrolase [Streptomyces hoynatensis]
MPHARSNGHRIAYEVDGEGPLLLLHPGMFQTGAGWAAFGYTEILRKSHTVVAVDPLGLGASDAPGEPAAYALERRAESVLAVLDDLGADRAAVWGYSMGALTVLGLVRYAPERCERVVAGAWDPVEGFASAVRHELRLHRLPADTDPYGLLLQVAYADPGSAAVCEAASPAALRANYEAFSRDRGLDAALVASPLPTLLYCGTEDPWHEPMRETARRAGAEFLSLPGADHQAGWARSGEVLAGVLPFLAADRM